MTTISPLDPETGTVTASGKVAIWLPDGRTQAVELAEFPADVTQYGIEQSDNRAPKGGPWRRLAARPYSGWYVASADVTWRPPAAPVADCSGAVATAVAADRAKAKVTWTP